ncbi:Twitching mobility protein [subsurface metagenome]
MSKREVAGLGYESSQNLTKCCELAIEYLHSDRKSAIEQREVGTDTLSFTDSLKYALHQDPDVILVGEMRDLETIAATITAAEAGHLVLATLHTRDAAQAIDRIVDVFPPLQQSQIRLQLSLSLEAVVAQNLLPRKYGEGRIPAVEILVATSAVRNLIRNAEIHQLYLVMETGARFGMQTMDQALKNLVRRGHIDPSLASRLARQAKDFRGSLKSGL